MTIFTIVAIAIIFAIVLFAGLMILGGEVKPQAGIVEWDANKWVADHDYKFRTASQSK